MSLNLNTANLLKLFQNYYPVETSDALTKTTSNVPEIIAAQQAAGVLDISGRFVTGPYAGMTSDQAAQALAIAQAGAGTINAANVFIDGPFKTMTLDEAVSWEKSHLAYDPSYHCRLYVPPVPLQAVSVPAEVTIQKTVVANPSTVITPAQIITNPLLDETKNPTPPPAVITADSVFNQEVPGNTLIASASVKGFNWEAAGVIVAVIALIIFHGRG